MRIIRDEQRIRRLSDVGQYASLGGLMILLVGLIISFVRPEATLALIFSMTLGFALSFVGGFFVERYAGSLAHHSALAEVLKGLDYQHILVQYRLPVDHVLLEPGGCTVCVVRTQGGKVTYENGDDGQWKHHQRGKIFRRLVGQAGVGEPHRDAREELARLEHYLEEHLDDPDDAHRIPVRAVIVFVNEEVELNAYDSPVPAFYRKKVKDWLRGPGGLRPLPAELRDKLLIALDVADEKQDDSSEED